MSALGSILWQKTIWVSSFSLLLSRRIATLFQIFFTWIFRTEWPTHLSRLVKRFLVFKKNFIFIFRTQLLVNFLRVLHCCSLLFVVDDYFSCVSSLVLTFLYAFWFLFVQLLIFVCMLSLIYFWDCYEYSTSSIRWFA